MLLHQSNIDLANMCVLSLNLNSFEVLGTVVLVIKQTGSWNGIFERQSTLYWANII